MHFIMSIDFLCCTTHQLREPLHYNMRCKLANTHRDTHKNKNIKTLIQSFIWIHSNGGIKFEGSRIMHLKNQGCNLQLHDSFSRVGRETALEKPGVAHFILSIPPNPTSADWMARWDGANTTPNTLTAYTQHKH